MHWLGSIVVLLAFVEGGWLAFDGGRALITGLWYPPFGTLLSIIQIVLVLLLPLRAFR